ncbi:MAG: hypothetical protein RLZ10_357 [Bacteroidota bacterium]|jgi:superfamily I DNA and/or RNA helicase
MSTNSQYQEIQNVLKGYLKKSFHIASNDPLANINSNGIIELKENSIHTDKNWDKLTRSVKSIQKEFGINPLCVSKGVLSINWKDKHYHFPIKLKEAKIKTDKISGLISIEASEDEIINPFLAYFIEREFDLPQPELTDDFSELFKNYEAIKLNLEKCCIGNFHPHRFEIIREIEVLLNCQEYSKSLEVLCGVGDNQDKYEMHLSNANLISADPDQTQALERIQLEDCVVQGPPGTGKSQVIVNLLGKILEKNSSAIVVSEKRVALDVIHKKMTAINLGGLCYTSTQHFSNAHFIEELKKEWRHIEISSIQNNLVNPISKFYYQELQNLLDLLHQPNVANGETIIQFLKKNDIQSLDSNTGYKSNLPAINEWEQIKPSIQFIQENELITIVAGIKTELIDQKFLELIESKITDWQRKLIELIGRTEKFTYENLFLIARKAVLFSKFNSSIFQKYGSQFVGKQNILKKLIKIRKNLIEIKLNFELKNAENKHWIKSPNEEECKYLITLFSKKGFLNSIKQKKEWKKWTKSPFLSPIDCIKSKLELIELFKQQQHIFITMNSLNIESIEDLEEIIQLNKSISLEDFEQYKLCSPQEIEYYSKNQVAINQLITDFKLFFRFENDIDLIDYFSQLDKSIFKLLEHVNKIKLNSKFLSSLCKNFDSIKFLEQQILASTWSKLKIDFPKLADFSWNEFYSKLQKANQLEMEESMELVKYILCKQKETFENYHKLLLQPSVKLTASEKLLKQELKDGKKILVKEFGKSKSHLSIRQLMESPARRWIQLLKPIWLLSPSRVSNCFPMTKNLFELAIFDEAGQIPFENALGALQRCNRVLIAGDPQQMGPSNYFSSASESIDLLHQASFYIPSIFLSYHYRSVHPELIAFSNQYFYQNRLHAFQDATCDSNPIEFHYVKNAYFNERINIEEAKEVVRFIEVKIHENNTLGIVTFSEKQLDYIYNNLNNTTRNKLLERIEQDEVFFKSLENVQGDECDELIISFGYGFSENDGKFNLRFGPLNQTNGHKRLNVLLTRAKKKIHFFASVKANDFKPSSNEAIELLRKWFVKMETGGPTTNNQKPTVYFPEILLENKNILTISTLCYIYKSRNWQIKLEYEKNVT